MSLGSIFRRVARIAIPAAIAYFTAGIGTVGGTAAAQAAGSGAFGFSAATTAAAASAGLNIASGGLRSTPKASPVTGAAVAQPTVSGDTTAQTADQAAAAEQRRKMAVNAAGSSGNNTTPLGVTNSATVTRRRLLGA